ncbi:MAG: long-chain fatty acid--CoA ligase, partial [Deltaproteobacteria bacterium]
PYAYGLSVLTSHLVAGASVRLSSGSPVQRAFWEEFAAHGCTSFSGVPASYQHLRRVGIADMALPSLRHMTQAGGRLPPTLVQHFGRWMDRRGGRFWVMYGQTEATARIAVLPPDEREAHPDSVGRAIPGGRLSIRTDDGSAAPAGVVGQVWFRGPSVMMGYAVERADLCRGDDTGGVLDTGDRGRLDADGRLYLEGPSDRLAKLHGRRFDLDEIEARAAAWGPTAVVGRDDRLHLFCAWGTEREHDALRRSLARELGLHRLDLVTHRIDALPLSAHGKLDRRRLLRGLAP